MSSRRASIFGLSLLSFAFAGACSAAPGTSANGEEGVASSSQRIIHGKQSDSSQDSVVLLVSVSLGYECSGTLLAPNLVLTARHCVSQIAGDGLQCDIKGNGTSLSATGADFVPGTIFVFTGNQRPSNSDIGSPKAKGSKIIHDGAKNLCNHDLALLLLDRKIDGAKIAQIRLDSPAKAEDTITAVGWGVTDTTSQPPVRMQRNGIKITALGPKDMPFAPVAPNDILVGEAFCQGDSGGPGFAEATGAVIGVVSHGGNGNQGSSPAWVHCTNADSAIGGVDNFYTRIDPFKDTILDAYSQAGQDPWIEGGPDPRLAHFGDDCTAGSDCQSNICFANKGKQTCSQDCTTNACPDGFDCKDDSAAGTKICKPHVVENHTTTTSSGCAAAPSPGGSLAWLGLGALGLFAAARRRRATSAPR